MKGEGSAWLAPLGKGFLLLLPVPLVALPFARKANEFLVELAIAALFALGALVCFFASRRAREDPPEEGPEA